MTNVYHNSFQNHKFFLAVTMWTAGLRGPGQLLLEGEGSIDFQRADGKKTHVLKKLQIS